MQRQIVKSKIHRATVTGCDVDYVGSVTVDMELLEGADILPSELVHVWDITITAPAGATAEVVS